jgi:hypothetical protein
MNKCLLYVANNPDLPSQQAVAKQNVWVQVVYENDFGPPQKLSESIEVKSAIEKEINYGTRPGLCIALYWEELIGSKKIGRGHYLIRDPRDENIPFARAFFIWRETSVDDVNYERCIASFGAPKSEALGRQSE